MKLHASLPPYKKINSLFKGLYISIKTIKLLEENLGVNIHGLELGNSFLKHDIKSTSKKRKK